MSNTRGKTLGGWTFIKTGHATKRHRLWAKSGTEDPGVEGAEQTEDFWITATTWSRVRRAFAGEKGNEGRIREFEDKDRAASRPEATSVWPADLRPPGLGSNREQWPEVALRNCAAPVSPRVPSSRRVSLLRRSDCLPAFSAGREVLPVRGTLGRCQACHPASPRGESCQACRGESSPGR